MISKLRFPTLFRSKNQKNLRAARADAFQRALQFETLECREVMALSILASQNHNMPADVNGDNAVAPNDVLQVVNYLNGVTNESANVLFMDTNNDSAVSPMDALVVTNYINDGGFSEGETVRFHYEVTDLLGNPKSTVGVGERFLLKTIVNDARSVPSGVFSAYLDVNFPKDLISFDFREKQTVSFTGNPTGGTYTLAFNDGSSTQTTPNISFTFSSANQDGSNATNAERIQAALEALSNIGPGNVKVTPTPRVSRSYDVLFGGKFANTNVQKMTATNTGLTGGSNQQVTVTETSGIDPTVAADFLGSVQFGVPTYVNGISGAIKGVTDASPGQLDEVGAFDGQTPLGGDEFLLFQVEMQAKATGAATISGESADVSPQHDVTIFGGEQPICPAAKACVGSIDYGSFTLTIADVIANDNATVDEDANATQINVLANDPGAPTAITAITQGSAGGTVTNNTTSVSYKPAANFFGTETFTYSAAGATATVTVVVREINDAPVANPDGGVDSSDDFFTTLKNTPKTILDLSQANNRLIANDNPGPGESNQTITITDAARTGDRGGTITLNGTTALYTPANNFVGFETFTYTLTDNGTSRGVADPKSSVGTFTVTVGDRNEPPTAVNDTVSADEDVVLPIPGASITGNDSAPEAGQTLTVTSVSAASSQGGTVSVTNNVVTYTPPKDKNGVDTFTYFVTDSGVPNATSAAPGTVTVNIRAVNDPPVAANDTLDADEGSSNNPLNVLSNDNAGPLEPEDTITITQVGTPTNGSTVTIATDKKSLVFTPTTSKDAPFSETFSYTITDAGGLTATASVTVNVNPLVRPKARGDSVTIDEGSGTVDVPVLTNDLGNAGFPLRITRIVSNATNGTATINDHGTASTADDSISYTVGNAEFFGVDTFTYEIDDDFTSGGTPSAPSIATVTVTVSAINDAPVNTVPATYTTAEDTSVDLTGIQVADIDSGTGVIEVSLKVNNGTLKATSTAGATVTGNQSATLKIEGTLTAVNSILSGTNISYTPSSNFNGVDSLVVSTDDRGNTGSPGALKDNDTAAITVTSVNDAPVNTVPGAQSAIKNLALTLSSAKGNAISIADVDAGTANVQVDLTVTKGTLTVGSRANVTVATNGTASVRLTGPVVDINALLAAGLTYQPNLNVIGAETLTVATSDLGNTGSGGAKTDTDVVNITISDFVPSTFSGRVFVDVNADGDISDVEPGLQNVVIRLTGTDFQNVAVDTSVRTDANGRYSFANVKPGQYEITEVQPAHFVDGDDLAGNLATLIADDKFSIEVGAAGGVTSSDNDFGELGLTANYAGLGIWDLLASSTASYGGGFTFSTNGTEAVTVFAQGWAGYSNLRVSVAPNVGLTITAFDTVAGVDRTVTIPSSSTRIRLRQNGNEFVVRVFGSATDLGLPAAGGAAPEGEDNSNSYARAVDLLFGRSR